MRLAFTIETLACMYLFQNNALGAATFSGNAIVKLFTRYSFFCQNLMLRANFTFQGRRKMSDFLFRPTRVTLESPSGAPPAPTPSPYNDVIMEKIVWKHDLEIYEIRAFWDLWE